MAQYYPVIIQAGRSLAGDSIGFHAYSLRLDNCSNQWYLEESSLAYIPPYSLGMCLRLYGTGVAILLNSAPIGQPQLAPIAGEQVVGVYSDQLRTEVAASPIRQFTFVQSVSDLTEGPQPALPPVGVDRLYADTLGNIHHLHSNGVDLTLVDPSNGGTLLFPTFDPHYQAMMNVTPMGGDVGGVVDANVINPGVVTNAKMAAGAAAANVGALGGILTGTLPNPTLSRLLSYPDLASGAANAEMGYATSTSGAVTVTTPGAIFGGAITNTLTSIGAPIVVWVSMSVQFSIASMIGYLDINVDGNWSTIAATTSPVASAAETLTGFIAFGVANIGALAAGTHTFTVGAHVNTGTMTIVGNPFIWMFANEFRR